MFKVALPDCDGVILDSEQVYFDAVRETFRHYGVEIGKEEYIRRWMLEQTESRGVIRDYGLAVAHAEVSERKARILESMRGSLQIMPGAAEMLQYLRTKGLKIGVVTSACRAENNAKMKSVGLIDVPDFVVAAEDVARKKPAPDPYLKGVEMSGERPWDVFVVEDNPSGVRSAKGAGCITIAYPNGFTEGMDFSHADAVVASLSEINDGMLDSLYERTRG